jgi:hypothetical protein
MSKRGVGPQPRAGDPAAAAEQHVSAAAVQRAGPAAHVREHRAAPRDQLAADTGLYFLRYMLNI